MLWLLLLTNAGIFFLGLFAYLQLVSQPSSVLYHYFAILGHFGVYFTCKLTIAHICQMWLGGNRVANGNIWHNMLLVSLQWLRLSFWSHNQCYFNEGLEPSRLKLRHIPLDVVSFLTGCRIFSCHVKQSGLVCVQSFRNLRC